MCMCYNASFHSTEKVPALTSHSVAPTTQSDVDQTNEVILRKVPDQPRVASFREEAVISKPPLRQSLKTADETVTVNFITKSSHIKTPFPVTHHQLLRDEDLESPGASDEEGAGTRDSTFTTPGFEHIDASTFDDFGTTIKPRLEETDKKEVDNVRKTLNLDESTTNELKQSVNEGMPTDETVAKEAGIEEVIAEKEVAKETVAEVEIVKETVDKEIVAEETVDDEPVKDDKLLTRYDVIIILTLRVVQILEFQPLLVVYT